MSTQPVYDRCTTDPDPVGDRNGSHPDGVPEHRPMNQVEDEGDSSNSILLLGDPPDLSSDDQGYLMDFEHLRDLLRDRVRGVAERYHVGSYIVGRPGSSKTHTAKETLDSLDTPWILRNGRMSAMGLWELLHEHPEHTVVLDDISSLFRDKGALQILLAALGGVAGEPRTVTYRTKDQSKSFEFAGGIVAISNVPLTRDPLADALVSRVVRLEFEPTDEMLIAFMREQAIRGFEDLTPEECQEVVEFVIERSKACDYRIDLRNMTKGWRDYRLDKHGKAKSPWQELVSSGLVRLIEPQVPGWGSRRERIEWERAFVRNLYDSFPDDPRRRVEEWKRVVGSGQDSMYRRKRELERLGQR